RGRWDVRGRGRRRGNPTISSWALGSGPFVVLDVIDPFVQVARVEQVLYFGPVGRGRDADAQEVGRRAVYGFDEAVGPGQRVAESQHRPAGRVLAERQGRVTAADGHHVGGGVAGPLADPREQQNRDIVDL